MNSPSTERRFSVRANTVIYGASGQTFCVVTCPPDAQRIADAMNASLSPEPGVDVAALNRELCEKEGHVLGVVARPCLRCHKWFDPQYGRNMPRDGLTLFALSVLTNLSSATPATHPDTYRVAQGYADAWLARSPCSLNGEAK